MWLWKQISVLFCFSKWARSGSLLSVSGPLRMTFDWRTWKARQDRPSTLYTDGPHMFPGGAFFEKQIPRPGASTHMQIGAVRVFSITCCDLHSWFVWAHHFSTSGQEGQDRLKWKYLWGCFLWFTVWHDLYILLWSRPHVAHDHVTEQLRNIFSYLF